MCGQYEAFQEAANRQSSRRQTCLKDLLQGNSFESLSVEEEHQTTIEVNHHTEVEIQDTTEKIQDITENASHTTSDTREYYEEKLGELKVEETVEVFQVHSGSETLSENKPFILTMDVINSYSIDPMIGMEDVTPYDFMSK